MEQNVDTGVPITPAIDNSKQNGGNRLKIATAIASIVAVCGIGFGVYGVMQSSQKDNQISDLKVQIKEDDGTITTIDTPIIETTDSGETTVTITENAKVSGGPYIENDYFYVPKWGVKFKLSDDLTNYGYAVDQNSQGDSYGNYVVGLSAILKSDYVENPQTQYYDDIFSCSQVTIRELEDSKLNWHGDVTPSVQFNGHDFIVHDTWRELNCAHVGGLASGASELVNQLKEILLNPEEI